HVFPKESFDLVRVLLHGGVNFVEQLLARPAWREISLDLAVPRFAVDAQEPRGEFRPVPVGELVNPVLDFVQRHDRTITLSANERNCGPRRIPLATRRPWP